MRSFSTATFRFVLFVTFLVSGIARAHLVVPTDTAIDITQSVVRVTYTTQDDKLQTLTASSMAPADVILKSIGLDTPHGPCSATFIKEKPLPSLNSRQFQWDFQCPQPLDALTFRYGLFFDSDPAHENMVRIRLAGRLTSTTLSKNRMSFTLPINTLLTQWQATLTQAPEQDPEEKTDTPTEGNISYFPLGIEHILSGLDHLLFLLALFALPLRWKSMLIVITSFTLAHSITLGISALNIFNFPQAIAEWLIALSIAVTAVENIFYLRSQPSDTTGIEWYANRLRFRWLLSFTFGLLHGFGFSYVLREIGLGNEIIKNLLMFNLGVETGQLIALVIASPLLFWLLRSKYQRRISMFFSVMAGIAGLCWMIERSSLI